MTDPYLLLTPVLALAVLALARFVACSLLVTGVDPPSQFPFVESFVIGSTRTDFTGWVGMAILVGDKQLTVRSLGRIMLTDSTAEHEVKLVQRSGDSDGIDLGTVTIPISAAIAPSANNPGFAYASLQPAIVLNVNTEYYIVSHEVTGGDVFHEVLDTSVTTTDVAQVTSGVFNDDADALYRRFGEPGFTYGPVDFIYEVPA